MSYTKTSNDNFSFLFIFFILTLAIETFFVQVIYSTFSLSFFLAASAFSLVFISRDRPLIPLLYVFSTVFAIFLYQYWLGFSEAESSYFLGRFSDDWHYDVLWSEGYLENYNLNPYNIVDHLNSITPGLGYLHNSKGYVYLIIVIKFFSNIIDDYHTLTARFFNLYLLALTAIVSLRSLEKSFKFRAKSWHVLLFLFFPTLVLTSSHVFRDTVVILLSILFFAAVLRYKANEIGFFRFYASAALIFMGLLTLRVSVVPMLVFSAIISFLRFDAKSIFATGLFFVVAVTLVSISYGDTLLRLFSTYSELNEQRFDGFARNLFSIPIHLGFLPRLVYSFYIPAPNFSNAYQMVSSLAAFLQIFAAPGLFRSLLSKKVPIEIKVFFVILWFSVVVSTMTFRHALMYLPFGIMLWIVGYQKKAFSINYRYFLEIIVFLLFSVLVFLSVSVIS